MRKPGSMGGYFIRGRGKWVAVMGAGAMVIAALVGGRWAREEYALWRLRSGSEEEKKRAAQTLSSLRVGRAVPELARVAREHGWEGYELGNFLLGSDFVQDWVL